MPYATRDGSVRSKWSSHFVLHRAVTTLYRLRRVPGSKGNMSYRMEYVFRALQKQKLMELFRTGAQLPRGYGRGLDERVVEYPWTLARLGDSQQILDAGSALNFEFIVNNKALAQKQLVIYTLSPDGENRLCSPHISYVYGDLRETVLRDAWFDTIVCLSTIEHVGMDNIKYTDNHIFREQNQRSYAAAMQEFHRLLKPEGQLLLTVPYGRSQNLGWMQQFDEPGLQKLIDTFDGTCRERQYYKSGPGGWQIATPAECTECTYVENERPHYNQASAVACVALVKR